MIVLCSTNIRSTLQNWSWPENHPQMGDKTTLKTTPITFKTTFDRNYETLQNQSPNGFSCIVHRNLRSPQFNSIPSHLLMPTSMLVVQVLLKQHSMNIV